MTVSIIVSAYNVAPWLGAALQSAMEQTERDIEIVVVDDGSTDDTLQMVREAAARDSRIMVLSQPNSGSDGAAKNVGIRASRGEFITFLDADDLYRRDKTERELAAFAACPELEVVFSDLARFRGDGLPGGNEEAYLRQAGFLESAREHLVPVTGSLYRCQRRFLAYMTLQRVAVYNQTAMVRRAALLRQPLWYRGELRVGSDIDLYLRLAATCRLGYVDEVLAFYRLRSGSVTTNNWDTVTGVLRAYAGNLGLAAGILDDHELLQLKAKIARYHRNVAHLQLQRGDARGARRSLLEARELSAAEFSRLDYVKTYLPLSVRPWKRRQ